MHAEKCLSVVVAKIATACFALTFVFSLGSVCINTNSPNGKRCIDPPFSSELILIPGFGYLQIQKLIPITRALFSCILLLL